MVFLIISVVIINTVALLIPKRMTRYEIWTTCLFASVLQLLTDLYLDLKYNLYGYFAPGVDWLALIPMLGLYPAASTIFLNFYPFRRSIGVRLMYIVGSTLICVFFEYLSVESGYFYYHAWKLWYSALSYPILLYILVWNLTFVRKLQGKMMVHP